MSHLRCVECDRLWSAEATKPGERCGVRLSGKHWCDGVLIEVKQLPAAVEQGLRDFSALRKEHDEAQAAAKSEIERITHNMVQTEKHAQIEEREVGRLNDLLNRILGDNGPDIDAYLDGHVEIPSIPGLCMQRDALVKELADLFGWSDRSYLHAAIHVKNAVLNMKADVSTSHEEVDLLTKKLVAAYSLLEQISDELREETECDCPPEWPRCVACRIRLRIRAALPKEKP